MQSSVYLPPLAAAMGLPAAACVGGLKALPIDSLCMTAGDAGSSLPQAALALSCVQGSGTAGSCFLVCVVHAVPGVSGDVPGEGSEVLELFRCNSRSGE